jgi:hypothetical protein
MISCVSSAIIKYIGKLDWNTLGERWSGEGPNHSFLHSKRTVVSTPMVIKAILSPSHTPGAADCVIRGQHVHACSQHHQVL